MAKIDQRGLVDDGTSNLSVSGDTHLASLSTVAPITSSAASFAKLNTFNNTSHGQILGAPTNFYQVTQWLSGTVLTTGCTPYPSASDGSVNNNVQISQEGWYHFNVSLSFSGSAGTYTFAMFENGVQDDDCTVQTTIAAGQPFPVHVSINDIDYHTSGTIRDVRVKCANAGANFLMNYGNWVVHRIIG